MAHLHLRHRRSPNGFTLLELGVTVVIIAILAALVLAVVGGLRKRAQRAQCMANLRGLHVAAQLYVQQNGSWPQIYLGGPGATSIDDFAKRWIEALQPFGVEAKGWICPQIQEARGNPDYISEGEQRVDYGATNFDDKPTSPYQWRTQPWFAELGPGHGSGPLMIFADGSINALNELPEQ